MPPMNDTGTNTAMNTSVEVTMADEIPFMRQRLPCMASGSFVKAGLHGLDHDYGIVDNRTDGKHKAKSVSRLMLKPAT